MASKTANHDDPAPVALPATANTDPTLAAPAVGVAAADDDYDGHGDDNGYGEEGTAACTVARWCMDGKASGRERGTRGGCRVRHVCHARARWRWRQPAVRGTGVEV